MGTGGLGVAANITPVVAKLITITAVTKIRLYLMVVMIPYLCNIVKGLVVVLHFH